MTKVKKIFAGLALILLITGCKKEDNKSKKVEEVAVENVKENSENEEKPVADKINVKPSSFASKLVLENMPENNSMQYLIDTSTNFSKILNKDFDIAIIPAYLAPYFYNKTDKGIKLLAINSTGNLYMLSDKKINGQMDYKGKDIYLPDLADNLNNIVENKLGPANLFMRINVNYYKTMDEILDKMNTSSNYVSILPDPYYARALRKNHYVSKLTDLLPLGEGDFISEVIIVNKDYLDKNKNIVDEFLKDYKKATDKVDKDTKLSESLLRDYDLSEEEASQAIGRMNITYVDKKPMKEIYGKFIGQIYDFDKKIFAGDLPEDDFYYLGK